MRKTLLAAIPVAVALVLTFTLVGKGEARSDGAAEPVVVTNFPKKQEVEVKGTPSQAELAHFTKVVVGPSSTGHSEDWRLVGSLDSSGFSWVVLSLGGEVQGTLGDPGAVTAVLVPDVRLATRALEEDGYQFFPLEAQATLTPGQLYFSSQPERLPLGFPRYRVYLYNTGDRSVEANLYAYLGN